MIHFRNHRTWLEVMNDDSCCCCCCCCDAATHRQRVNGSTMAPVRCGSARKDRRRQRWRRRGSGPMDIGRARRGCAQMCSHICSNTDVTATMCVDATAAERLAGRARGYSEHRRFGEWPWPRRSGIRRTSVGRSRERCVRSVYLLWERDDRVRSRPWVEIKKKVVID